MPQLSPINWMLLFLTFWTIMILNMSVLWWNTNHCYFIKKNSKSLTNINYKW
uniref:ATP synthase F0 subunit 8 n=1 Tax=Sepioloidea lineolata TaxID=61742 RepID=A0A8F5CEU6_SEPLI|nr:ATP synthase F0 subunit 8 [Sepioloidea lineolata]